MSNAIFRVPDPANEPVRTYIPGSEYAKRLIDTYRKRYKEKVDIPLYIGGKEIRTGNIQTIHPPHDHQHSIGEYHLAQDKETTDDQFNNALEYAVNHLENISLFLGTHNEESCLQMISLMKEN